MLGAAWAVLALCAATVIRHHVAYFRRTRPYSFGAFLETSGWIILLLVAAGALYGGLAHAGTRTVEIAAAIVGLGFVGIGASFR